MINTIITFLTIIFITTLYYNLIITDCNRNNNNVLSPLLSQVAFTRVCRGTAARSGLIPTTLAWSCPVRPALSPRRECSA